MRTSLTHPLQINEIPLASGGRIGLTFCPGKQQRYAATGAWHRDLAIDLARIQAWGAQAVVTLMEDHELTDLKVAPLGAEVEALGLDWYSLPIRDVAVPDARFEAHWGYAGHRLRRLIQSGGRVLLHCKGGLGRTGTIAARLLVECGWDPQVAIQTVRTARPGAIETPAQERYVRAAPPPARNEAFLERALGCLFGGAVGDGFGYAIEFDSLATIRRRFGQQGLREPILQNGHLIVSDDTQMTLFTLEGMLRSFGDGGTVDSVTLIAEIRQAYQDWLATQVTLPTGWQPAGALCQWPALRHRRAPGNTCLSALRQGGTGTVQQPINDSKGCGGVMRVAPLGWLTAWPQTQVFKVAAEAAALTHGHPSGYLSAGALAALVWGLFHGQPLAPAANEVLGLLDAAEAGLRRPEVAGKVAQALALARDGTDPGLAIRRLGEGWVGEEALAIGLYAALIGQDFAEAIQVAANHDGDSDSTASIAGQLYGAWQGLAAIPLRWVRRLDVFEEMVGLVEPIAAWPFTAAEITSAG